ncbi:MAG TPA: hypothetical protein VFH73_07940 [Polyangia bacterium]|nr:hypothetical protein [Polyangia bacterium]
MHRPILAAFCLLSLSCVPTPAFTSRRLEDGTYQLRCRTELSLCLSRVDEVCRGKSYDVVSANDRRRPIDVTIGSYQRETRSSEAIIRCTLTDPTLVQGAGEPASALPSTPARTCIPGATQACVGPAACAGGQACLPDGSGFGPCNCGPPAHPRDAGTD